MTWYNGTIEQAIAEAKSSSKLMVVYTTGDDDNSIKMNLLWNVARISNLCKSKCICLKFKSDSVAGQQFSQIFPILIVPCTYMIGTSGTPLEIIGGGVDETQLYDKLNAAILKNNQLGFPQPSAVSLQPAHIEPPSHDRNSSVQSNRSDTNPPTLLPEDIPHTTTTFSDDDTPSASQSSKPVVQRSSLTANEKVKNWQEKLSDYREVKQVESEKDKKMKEIARRTTGKQIQEMKETKNDMRRKNEIEERKKEKVAQAKALKNVREQIARDRAEKQKKFEADSRAKVAALKSGAKQKAEVSEEEQRRAAEERNKFARIQYRLPDGSSLTRKYNSTDVFDFCMKDLKKENPCGLPLKFELFTTMPSRVFGHNDMEKTVADLKLTPNAIIYVRPIKVHSPYSWLEKLFSFLWFLLSLPFRLLRYILQLLGLIKSSTEQSGSVSSFTDSEPDKDSKDLLKKSKPNKPGHKKLGTLSEGNVARLRHRLYDDDDDDSATWNGNSTQQL